VAFRSGNRSAEIREKLSIDQSIDRNKSVASHVPDRRICAARLRCDVIQDVPGGTHRAIGMSLDA
jgi:hypothetical protein